MSTLSDRFARVPGSRGVRLPPPRKASAVAEASADRPGRFCCWFVPLKWTNHV